MFDLEGKRTQVSRIAQAFLDSSWVKAEGLRCSIYRRDPLDDYQFIVALSGLEQEEPMFGPMVWDDARRKRPPKDETKVNPLGFKSREGTVWHHQFPRADEKETGWVIHINGPAESTAEETQESKRKSVERFEKELLPPLRDLLERNDDKPLFPKLWYEERLARDKMRDRFRHLQPSAQLDVVACALKRSLQFMMARNLSESENYIGIYLNTDKSWDLVGGFEAPERLPETVGGNNGFAKSLEDFEEEQLDDLNAFAWVDLSTRPVLLRPKKISDVWRHRIRACGADLANVIHDKHFAGLCIVPLLDLNRPQRSMGVILLVSIGIQDVCPAHLFLLSRMGWPTSGYLTPLLPISGYPRWPDLDLLCEKDRGTGSTMESPSSETMQGLKDEGPRGESTEIPFDFVKKLAHDFLPPGSEVTVRRLSSGHSGAEVFRLGVKSRARVLEVPRVLKVGPVSVITEELSSYYRHVHNKALGGAARVEFAAVRVFRERLREVEYGAIIYTMVGAGRTAQPWSRWAKEVDDLAILERALKRLEKQLVPWYETREQQEDSAIDLLVTRPFVIPGVFKPSMEDLTNPDENEVRELLTRISRLRLTELSPHTTTCIVHGDLHTNNVFVVLNEELAEPQAISLIDWGSVRDRAHPLSDIARLTADLCYRVLWQNPKLEAPKKWAFDIVKSWKQDSIGSTETDRECNWRLALIHQIAKMLFWRSDSDSDETFFSAEARQAAWRDVQDLGDWLVRKAGASADRRTKS